MFVVNHYVGKDIHPDLSIFCLDQSNIEEMTRIYDAFILFILFNFFFYVYIAYIYSN